MRESVLNSHRLYRAAKKGDTLIVSFQGEAMGYSPTEAEAELQAVQSYYKRNGVECMIVNLGGAAYVGTQMVGSLAKLAETVQYKGGEFAICEPSNDTREIFRALGLGENWQVYDHEADAIREVVTERFRDKLKVLYRPKLLAWMAVLVAGFLGGWFVWQSYSEAGRTQKAIAEVEEIWKRYEVILRGKGTPEKWAAFQNEVLPRLKSLSAQLEQPGELVAVRFRVKRLIDNSLLPVIKRDRSEVPDTVSFVADQHKVLRREIPQLKTWLTDARAEPRKSAPETENARNADTTRAGNRGETLQK